MGTNNVTQPIALALQEAGWEWETEFSYTPAGTISWTAWSPKGNMAWLPAPNVTEIGEELKWSYYYQYWWRATDAIIPLAEWLYSIMHNANELAKVWMWKKGGK